MDSSTILTNIISKQNREILYVISNTYNIDYDKLIALYNTPTFYHITKKMYNTKEKQEPSCM